MKTGALWEVSIAIQSNADDAVAELVQSVFARSAVSWTDTETGTSTISVYLDERPDWPRQRAAIVEGLERLRRCGLSVKARKVSLRRLRREDWAESWKRHFKPLEIGRALLIKPGWIARRGWPGQKVVVIDPGLSFGTGQHPTTRFCLEQIVARRARTASFLDIGTGSGILAIAAAKLGYRPVDAFDVDPEAVRIAQSNARRNRVPERLRIVRADLARLSRRPSRQYDLICANLIFPLLIGERRRLIARLQPRGALVIAGVLTAEFPGLQQAFERDGLKRIARRIEGEWCSGAFERAVQPSRGPRTIIGNNRSIAGSS